MLENVLLVCNRNAVLLRLVGATFDTKVEKDEKEKFNNSKQFAGKKFAIFCFICLSLLPLSCQISIESVRKIVIFSLNVLMTVLHLKFYSI